VRYEPGPPAAAKEREQDRDDEETGPDSEPMSLSATRVNAFTQNGEAQEEATQTGESTNELESVLPGAYWIQATASRPGVCVGAVSAGGQDLARMALGVGPTGAGMPIEVVLRTDCAKLTVQLPGALSEENSGEGATSANCWNSRLVTSNRST